MAWLNVLFLVSHNTASYHWPQGLIGLPHTQVNQAVLHDDLGFGLNIDSTPEPNELAVDHGHLQHGQFSRTATVSAQQHLELTS
jgi:hypothetical protein